MPCVSQVKDVALAVRVYDMAMEDGMENDGQMLGALIRVVAGCGEVR